MFLDELLTLFSIKFFPKVDTFREKNSLHLYTTAMENETIQEKSPTRFLESLDDLFTFVYQIRAMYLQEQKNFIGTLHFFL